MTDIIVPSAAADAAGLIHDAAAAQAAGADMLELRLDRSLAAGADAHALLAAIAECVLPILVTVRDHSEGGEWQGNEEQRRQLLASADEAGAAFIDYELAAVEALNWQPSKARLILSYHDFSGPGKQLRQRIDAMYAAGATIAKVAITPRDAHDLGPLADAVAHAGQRPVIGIAMGPFGAPSRLLAGAWGCSHTFARLDADDPGSAPGQPTVRELLDDYRLRAQTRDSLILGVIGNPIGHSLSPAIHNAALAHDGMDAIYVPFLVDDAQAFWRSCHGWIDGLSITIPHKQALIEDTSANEDLALAIGAINTLYRNEQGAVIGANTDAQAALDCVNAVRGEVQGARCLVLGAGGVSRAICFALKQAGAQLMITNRSPERAAALAHELAAQHLPWESATEADYDVLINCTAVGMREDVSPWPAEAHRPGTCVFDTVYTPLETRLLREAAMAGCRCQDGLRMFIKQAAAQYQRWLGRLAPEAIMHRRALERLAPDLLSPTAP
ncbi:MAG: shikimate dehydrogenase [Planctomycetota bacterium]|nr:MAG: shikimate dehydrogenase [Planctomycetota bacterium]